MTTYQLTPEQQHILQSSARINVIEAFAGCGKSFMLHQLALHNPTITYLYLVFGHRAKQEAEQLFADCPHVKVKTIHGHAYACERGRWKASESALSIAKIHGLLSGTSETSYEIAWMACAFLQYYLSVPTGILEEAYYAYLEICGSDEKKSLGYSAQKMILEVCEKVLETWVSETQQCPHDFYVKQSYISGSFQKGLQRYQCILLDEAQDLSPIMYACLEKYAGQLFVVGDSFQSIYGFRYALNALAHVPADEVYTLSKSFRFGKAIAEFVTEYMQTIVNPTFYMLGNEQIQSTVICTDRQRSKIDVILARTNFDLVHRAVQYTKKQDAFYFEKDVSFMCNRLEDLWHLAERHSRSIHDEFLKTFQSLSRVKKYATTIEDSHLLNLISVLETYQSEFPQLIYELREHIGQTDGIALSTVHTAKGQEYDSVGISSDLYIAVARCVSKQMLSAEEYRILYVALTRARCNLYLPGEFAEICTSGWKQWQMKCLEKDTLQNFWKSVK